VTVAGDAPLFTDSIHTTHRPAGETRTERDSLGVVEVPAEAYWGVHTARALENFAISGRPISEFPDLIVAYACVKQAAARANREVGSLPSERAGLIEAAAEEIRHGGLRDQFVVDVIQGGAGTSTNMNVNEVIANRGLELAGHRRGAYQHLDPLDDVNRSQSTNDTYPTALKLALHTALGRLDGELGALEQALRDKAREFTGVLKVGRTQLQDAVPMTLEQELAGFAVTLGQEHVPRESLARLRQSNLGATAVGTGIAADPRFAQAACRHLEAIVGLSLQTAPDLVAATSDMGVFMEVSANAKRLAMKLSKICNDLRLLSSGPQFGLGEISLPPRQAGSSIMPGKVNPVIPEVVNQVCFAIAGSDTAVAMACEAGQLQLNAFGPLVAGSLLMSLKWLTAAMITLRDHCIAGLTANRERLASQSAAFVGVVTAFAPYLGYQVASELAGRALASGTSVTELVVAEGLMEGADVRVLTEPARLSGQETSPPSLTRAYAPADAAPPIRE
jgi:aspartate ammonia-lyase